MRNLAGIDTSKRSPEGWVPLPLLIRGLEEAERVTVQIGPDRFLVGHTVRDGARWFFVTDWRAAGADLARFARI